MNTLRRSASCSVRTTGPPPLSQESLSVLGRIPSMSGAAFGPADPSEVSPAAPSSTAASSYVVVVDDRLRGLLDASIAEHEMLSPN